MAGDGQGRRRKTIADPPVSFQLRRRAERELLPAEEEVKEYGPRAGLVPCRGSYSDDEEGPTRLTAGEASAFYAGQRDRGAPPR